MKNKLYLFCFFIAISLHQVSTASHIMGGELTYDWWGGNNYLLRYTFYRDCSGIAAPVNVDVQVYDSTCTAWDTTVYLNPTPFSPIDVSNICPLALSTCNGGPYTGVMMWVYEGMITLPGPCSNWTMKHVECCRNAAITNMVGAGSIGAQFTATLNNLVTPFNNSPQFGNDPVLHLDIGSYTVINNGAYDLDGDSLAIELTPPLNDSGNAVVFNSGYSYSSPIIGSTAIQVDPVTGDITVFPTQSDVDVLAYKVSEYRNGQLIGTITRDLQINISGNANQLPLLTGINGIPGFVTNTCVGDTLRFWVYAHDPDASDSLTISYDYSVSNASITTFGAAGDTAALVTFIPDSGTVLSAAYSINLTVSDNKCPYSGVQHYSYKVYVNGCSTDVWPGDANNDLTADLYDILPIGVGFGASGPARTGASLNWSAQPGTNWPQQFGNGNNYLHADCNGDGVIDWNDTTAIGLNYALMHPLRVQPQNQQQTTTNEVFLYASRDTVSPGDAFFVDVHLGNNFHPATDAYGIAFRIDFDPALIDPSHCQFHFLNSAFGTTGTDLLTFSHADWAAGHIDIAAVRTNHAPVTCNDIIGRLNLAIAGTVSSAASLYLNISGMRAMNDNGMEQDYLSFGEILAVNASPLGIRTPEPVNAFTLYPNPAQDEVAVRMNGMALQKITVKNMLGQSVLMVNHPADQMRLDVHRLPDGIYLVEGTYPNGSFIQKLKISR